MLLELSDAVELLVAEVARVVILELEPKVCLAIWSTPLLVAVELPFCRKGLFAVITTHVACPVEHVATNILLFNDLCKVRV